MWHIMHTFGFDWEDVYQTLETMFDHISKHLEVRQEYYTAHCNYSVFRNAKYRDHCENIIKISLTSLIYFVHITCSLTSPLHNHS